MAQSSPALRFSAGAVKEFRYSDFGEAEPPGAPASIPSYSVQPHPRLHKLMGTVKYPAQAAPRRSSLSRVPENGTHGLKGEIRNGLL
jgi:hypothetical protein